MALMTGEQYIESIRSMNMEVYMFGKRVECPVDDPILRPSLNSVRATYDLAQMPEYQDLMTAISPYTGERVNRFTHIHQSTEDLSACWVSRRLHASSVVLVWMPLMPNSPPPMKLTRSTVLLTMRTSRSS